MTQQIQFKENPAAGNLGLEKSGKSKFPGCYDVIQPPKGKDGRWKTGMDELASEILSIKDQAIREETIAKIKAERESLEEITGLDLSGRSLYWEDYFFQINPVKMLDLSNAKDRIAYNVIMASGAVAPNLRDAQEPEYRAAKYYLFRDFEDVSERVEEKARYNEAITQFVKLQKNPEKERLIAKYLELNVSDNTPKENMDDAIQVYLDSYKTTNAVDRFLAAISKSPEEIGVKLVFAEGIKLGVIRQRDGLFQRGNITMGTASKPEEVIIFLSDPKNSGELLSIKEEIELKRKFG